MPKFLVIILVLFIFLGCSQKKEKTPPSSELRISFKYNPLTVDPKKNSDPLSCSLINMLFEGLVKLEPSGEYSLALAKSIQISKNKTRYTFHLKDSYWSDGSEITALDFVDSWKQILSPDFNSINAYFLYPIKNAKAAKKGLVSVNEIGVFAKDKKTLVIKLEHPNPSFLKMLAFTTYFPTKSMDEFNENEKTNLPFSGPFVIEQWKTNDYIILKKNHLFWNACKVKLDRIHISIIPDENTSLKLLQTQKLDWIGSFFSPIPQDAIASSLKQSNCKSKDTAGTSMCFFNTNTYPFNNVNIRKAFAYSIDRDEIAEHICQIPVKKAYRITPGILQGSQNGCFIPKDSGSIAKELLEKGLKELCITKDELPKLVFTFYNSDLEKTLASALQNQWLKTLGIKVSLEMLDVKIFLDKLHKKNYQFCLMSIIAQYFDQMNFLERFTENGSNKNFTGWEHKEFKRLLDLSSECLIDSQRTTLLEKAERLLMDEMPVAPIYHHNLTYIQSSKITGVEISPLGTIDFRYCYLIDLKETPK
jgi:oligopeptide transport system substrate-binding protein